MGKNLFKKFGIQEKWPTIGKVRYLIQRRIQNLGTAQKKVFPIKDFFSKCDQMWHLLKKSLIKNFVQCVKHLTWSFFPKIVNE